MELTLPLLIILVCLRIHLQNKLQSKQQQPSEWIQLEALWLSELQSNLIFKFRYFAQLKEELADFWGVKSLLIYSAGWLAGFGAIKALIREKDHVIMDQLSHNCLQEGSNAATKNVHKFRHLDHKAMVEVLRKTRENDKENAILVVT